MYLIYVIPHIRLLMITSYIINGLVVQTVNISRVHTFVVGDACIVKIAKPRFVLKRKQLSENVKTFLCIKNSVVLPRSAYKIHQLDCLMVVRCMTQFSDLHSPKVVQHFWRYINLYIHYWLNYRPPQLSLNTSLER